MSFLGKDYTFVKQENFDNFLRSIGLPDDKIKGLLSFTPTQKWEKDGDTYTFTSILKNGTKVLKFKSGEEFEDTIGEEKMAIKNKFVVEGNKVTQSVSGPQGVATFIREFKGDDLEMTITSTTWDGVAKRWYKA